MMKLIVIWLNLLGPIQNKVFQEKLDSIRLSEVIRFADLTRGKLKSKLEIDKVLDCNDFDFNELKQINQPRRDNRFFSIGLDKSGKVLKVSAHSDELDDNFEYVIFSNSEKHYDIIHISNFEDKTHRHESEAINGFILRYNRKCYFIGRINTDSPSFFRRIYEISALMTLDSHLRVIWCVKMEHNKVEYISRVNYEGNTNVLKSASIYSTNKGQISLTNLTTVKDVESLLPKINATSLKELKFGLPEFAMHLPLWAQGGNHVLY